MKISNSNEINPIKLSSKIEKEKDNDDPPPSLNIKTKVSKGEPGKAIGSFFVGKNNSKEKSNISYKINNNNFKIKISDNLEYSVYYPNGILSNLNKKAKEILLDNFIYSRTIPLTLNNNNVLHYQMAEPFLKDFVDHGVLKDLPRISELTKIEMKKLLETFNDSKNNGLIVFKSKNKTEKLLPLKSTLEKVAVLSLSFGRDSLLSYGLAKEIGLDCYPAFINDMEKYSPVEFKIKKAIMESFSKEQKQPVFYLTDDTDNIFRAKKIKKEFEELDGTNAMLSFALELIPLAYYLRAKYIIFGNERNLNDFFMNKDKFRVYPSYDQSSIYMRKENKYLNGLTDGNIRIISLVEPLYNIAEMKILYHRYPYFLKYLMSCFSKKLSNDKWCCQCPTCTSAYLTVAAIGGNPQKIGIQKNLFERKYKEFYPVFASKISRVYEKPPRVREEQLLAFLLAYRNGFKGTLIDLFKHKYLKKVEKREKELRKKFFSIHTSHSMPQGLKNKVLKIYDEELKNLM